MEKLLEQEVKEQLNKHFEGTEIIPDQHHGGRLGNSTMSAKAIRDKMNADNIENHDEVILLTTDLSQAFDLVDNETLLEKMKFHRVGKVSRETLKSFLQDRKFLVE